MKKLLIVFVMLFLAFSCKSDVPPILADFTFVGGSYGNVQFTNQSLNATTYLFDFGDGTTNNSPNTSHTYSENKAYTVSLTASNGAISSKKEKVVNVTTVPMGDCMIWIGYAGAGNIPVFWDGVLAGTITGNTNGTEPNCGDSRFVTVTKSAGIHTLKFYSLNNQAYDVEIYQNFCRKIEIVQ